MNNRYNGRNCTNSGKAHIEERRLVFRGNALGDFNVRKGTTVRGAARSSHSRERNVFLPRGRQKGEYTFLLAYTNISHHSFFQSLDFLLRIKRLNYIIKFLLLDDQREEELFEKNFDRMMKFQLETALTFVKTYRRILSFILCYTKRSLIEE